MGIVIGEELRLTVFDYAAEASLACSPRKRVGRRLIAVLSAPVRAGALVKLHGPNSVLFGEVLACWREHRAVNAVIELEEVLVAAHSPLLR